MVQAFQARGEAFDAKGDKLASVQGWKQ